ncbi:Bug family tripartite tricarboxylate transporter substrate binding protein [Caldovatus aquaticus]|uniref:Tripartite tricarboxylate transporter substrate binding protein n=1 Tax=Caldovatus aquaticus TaxID=2865671 RepID=A0ABS7F5Y4_9PROT|nr:tripartite tricarboxylate transporter substrate binding protein [Caldovatus aquaticus]
MKRRTLLASSAAALAVPGIARAQAAWPARPIRMVIPWPPGQATDLAGRLIAQRLSELLGQPVVPENRPGAGGMIGTDAVAKAAPDGYTILAASSGPVTINPLLQRTAYDPERDLAPVAQHSGSPYMLVVRKGFPASDLRAFIAAVKAAPGRYTFSSSGTGATAHLIAEYFLRSAGLEAVHVPFQGSAPSMTALVAGQVDFSLETMAGTLPIVRQGQARGLAVSPERGTKLAPELPPIATVIPGFDAKAWGGIMVPAATPRPIVERLAAAMEQVMTSPGIEERFLQIYNEIDYRPADAFARYLREQREKFSDIIRRANIRLE